MECVTVCGIVPLSATPGQLDLGYVRYPDGSWRRQSAVVTVKELAKGYGQDHSSTHGLVPIHFPMHRAVWDPNHIPGDHDRKFHLLPPGYEGGYNPHRVYMLNTKGFYSCPHGHSDQCLGDAGVVPFACADPGCAAHEEMEIIDGEYREIPDLEWYEKKGVNWVAALPAGHPIYKNDILKHLLTTSEVVREPVWATKSTRRG